MTIDAGIGAELATRFRRESDWFVASRRGSIHVASVGTIGERAVDLLRALAVHLDPAVDVVLESLRDGAVWEGRLLALPDVREAIGRLRLPLAMYGGVELTLVTPEDQLTLTPELAIVIYARSDRWLFLLEGMGLVERAAAPPPVWRPSRLGLERVPPTGIRQAST
jgi:hypothetical protein